MSNRTSRESIRALSVSERRDRREKLLEQYGPYCQLCLIWGKSRSFARIDLTTTRGVKSFSLDHIVPVAQGGTNKIDNLWPTHIACNEQRKDLPLTVKVEVDFNRHRVNRARREMAKVRLAYSTTSKGY